MLTEDGPKVLEFNCRFGDPETQSLLPLLGDDFVGALAAAATGDLDGVELRPSTDAAVTVVLAAEDYPARPDHGSEIVGVEEAEALGALVFHAGTARHDERLVTSGGRILNVTATGRDDRQRARPCLRGVRADLVLRSALPPRHRAGGGGAPGARAAGALHTLRGVIARYSRPAMARIWSDETKLARWLEVELAALEGWAEHGAVPRTAVDCDLRGRGRLRRPLASPRSRPRPSTTWRHSWTPWPSNSATKVGTSTTG